MAVFLLCVCVPRGAAWGLPHSRTAASKDVASSPDLGRLLEHPHILHILCAHACEAIGHGTK